ncbi:MAG: glycoside hydrolase family 127 protein [Treponema sp.]|nr:glycoside hydrolase family 127 protein [Treponema sp.]
MLSLDAAMLRTAAPDDGSVHYIGHWISAGSRRFTRLAYQRCFFTFSGNRAEVWAAAGPEGGICEVWLDGQKETSADCYEKKDSLVCIYKKEGLPEGLIHNLVLVNTSMKNAESNGTVLEPVSFKARTPVDYKAELKRRYFTEYEIIGKNQKTWKPFETWKPVPFAARMPERGVKLTGGIVRRLFDQLIEEIKYDFSIPHYCDGAPKEDLPEEDLRKLPGWAGWLSGSNEGRMLGGAAGVLRWEEDPQLRKIVNKITGDIKKRMRGDGYHNYYPEENSYAKVHTIEQWIDRTTWCGGGAEFSERKNYDRVFWTRGLLAALMAGNGEAGVLLRRFYDWFNTQEKYLVNMLRSANSANGLPGGPLVYLSPIGKADDLVTSLRYLDQDFWIDAFAGAQPLAPIFYPGDRPHCYTLLFVETLADEYLATGDERYHKALMSAWDIYDRYYKHTGGFISIGELSGPYCGPLANYLTTHGTGETCGQVFWAWINQRLMQLYPHEEKYTAQVEEVLYNTLICGKIEGKTGNAGYLPLQGKRGGPGNSNGCCQVSSTMADAALPQWIYMTSSTTVYINLFVASTFDSPFGKIIMETGFPYSGDVTIGFDPLPKAGRFDVSIRVPYWAQDEAAVYLNGSLAAKGKPGKRITLNRLWQKGDRLNFTLSYGPRLIKYTGADQSPDGKSRYTMMCGPILMAYLDPLCTEAPAFSPKKPEEELKRYIPHIDMECDELLASIKADADLRYPVPGTKNAFVPYWSAPDEGFSCVPVIGC